MKMAALLKTLQEENSLDLFILYENDSLFIRYKDGTSVELSPCGTAFLHREAALCKRRMKQLTRFAVSSFRTKIIEAVRIRNLFAARPYLCKELTSQHELRVSSSAHVSRLFFLSNTWYFYPYYPNFRTFSDNFRTLPKIPNYDQVADAGRVRFLNSPINLWGCDGYYLHKAWNMMF